MKVVCKIVKVFNFQVGRIILYNWIRGRISPLENGNYQIPQKIPLFEFEDLKEFPTFLRNYGTDFLQLLANKSKMYKPIILILQKGIEKVGQGRLYVH